MIKKVHDFLNYFKILIDYRFILEIFLEYRFILAFIVRLGLIVANDLVDKHLNINYTDIDYHVISDGARHIITSQGPYKRASYRYSPYFAVIMLPNIYIHYDLAKVFICLIDVSVGKLIEVLLNIQEDCDIKPKDKYDFRIISLLYIFNPLMIYISTRGSTDCLMTFLIILTIILIEMKLNVFAGIVYGFSVHMSIYPLIYFVSFYLYIGYKNLSKIETENSSKSLLMVLVSKILSLVSNIKRILHSILNLNSIIFAICATFTFITLFNFFFLIYGRGFVYETYLHHLIRKENRNNYSLYFYMNYLNYSTYSSKILSYITILNQFCLVISSSVKLFPKINFCIFVQTMVLVTFNHSVRVQCFVCYMSLLPLLLPYNDLFKSKKIILTVFTAIWAFYVLLWGVLSIIFENMGYSVFLEMWVSTILFFFTNCFFLSILIWYQT